MSPAVDTAPAALGPRVETRTLGRWTVHAIQAGGQRLDGGAMFGVVPKPLWQKRIAPDDRNRIQLGMRCLLIEHDIGPVLIDTGAGNKETEKFYDIYAVVDVEATGGRVSGGDRITEVAVVQVKDGVATTLVDTLVNPQRIIPPWVSRLTNISAEMVRCAPTFAEICDQVLGALDGRVFVAHNVNFDWRFLNMEIERATGRTLAGRKLCTVKLVKKLLPQLRRRSLDWVALHYGVEIRQRHRAGGDAEATARVFQRLLSDACGEGCESWHDLQRLLIAPTPKARRSRRPPALPQPVDKDTTA